MVLTTKYHLDGPLPILPGQGNAMDDHSSRQYMAIRSLDTEDGRANIPLGPEDTDDFFYSTSEEDSGWLGALSPITERTEITEYSSDWPLPVEPPIVEHDYPRSSASSTSYYGDVIGK